MTGSLVSDSLLPAETRQEGIHIFGLNSPAPRGSSTTHISDLNLGTLPVLSRVKNDTTAVLLRALGPVPQDRPRIRAGPCAPPRERVLVLHRPTTRLWRRWPGATASICPEVCRVRQTDELGILYERIGDPQEKSIKGRE